MRPTILPPTIVTIVVFMIMKVLKCLKVMEGMDIVPLITDTLPLTIADFIIVVIIVEVGICLNRAATPSLSIVEFIFLFLMVELELYLRKQSTLTLLIVEKELVLIVEMDIGLRSDTPPPKIHFYVVYF